MAGQRWVETAETVRFNEVDEWGMAWYGHYLAWFEVGRMALLRRFDLLPDQMVALGYLAPVINVNCDYLHPAACGNQIVIGTTVGKPEIAALNFFFEVRLKDDRRLLARGETTQVLLTNERKMIYRLGGELAARVDRMVRFCTAA